ncbi:endo-1,4-beta-xylanase [Paraglaciecola sp. L3A3]|uniref:endo-1,4-beta-xylanase n=1 Tax=Paraglaciecola sp. L3A3 TaxID=2686358 RepID=UPI00131CA258|nr:endo-1,4-beta-xylanase [Paraglaciecola sp. L3A3]
MSVVQIAYFLLVLLSCLFVACGGSDSTSPETTVPLTNKSPTANAGPDQTVNELSEVTLIGTGTDPDGTIKSYSWIQTSTGSNITLANAHSASANFTAPDVAADETITFELTVTDNNNASHTNSVSITIVDIEEPPIITPTEKPEGGTLIISSDAVSTASFWQGNGSQPVGTKTLVNVEHANFYQAIEMDITNPSGISWNGQLSIELTQGLQSGDNILLHLFFRTLESEYETGTGFTKVLLQGPEARDYYKIIHRNINSSSDWVEYFISATVGESFTKDELQILFELGAGDKPQKFQLAGIELFNYQQTLDLAELPNTKPTYDGREKNAAWRVEAQARIEQHRKGDFTLTLQTAAGENIGNTDIEVAMTKHAYHFGTAIATPQLLEESDNGDIYREKVLELFNQAGPENSLKWPAWSGEWGSSFSQSNTIDALQWLHDHDLYTRGHVLVWPSKRNLPNAVHQYITDDPANADPLLLEAVNNRIDDVTSKTAHLLKEWDVLNEPYDNHYIMDAFGDKVMVDWFDRARANLPDHKLYINDYSILSAAGLDVAHQDHYKKTIQYLVDQNAEIDGIGLQSHFSDVLTGIPKVYQILDGFHQAFPDLLMRSTEFDIKTSDEELQADYTHDFMTVFFSHPSTVGIQLWGFWAGRHWYPEAAMYRDDWTAKPNSVVWKDLIFNQWASSFNAKTNEQGQFSERAFYGDYQVSFSHNNKEIVMTFSIVKGEDNNITLKLTE